MTIQLLCPSHPMSYKSLCPLSCLWSKRMSGIRVLLSEYRKLYYMISWIWDYLGGNSRSQYHVVKEKSEISPHILRIFLFSVQFQSENGACMLPRNSVLYDITIEGRSLNPTLPFNILKWLSDIFSFYLTSAFCMWLEPLLREITDFLCIRPVL
jgi:hypothetical protein